MELSPKFPAELIPAGARRKDRRVSNRVYQVMTIAAMLLLLCSLWVF